MFPYRIVTEWSEADACFVARVPALANCAAHGDTVADASREVQAAGELMRSVLGDLSPPSDLTASYSGNLRLRLPRSLHAKLARRATQDGVSLNTLLIALLAERTERTSSVIETAAKAIKQVRAHAPVAPSRSHGMPKAPTRGKSDRL